MSKGRKVPVSLPLETVFEKMWRFLKQRSSYLSDTQKESTLKSLTSVMQQCERDGAVWMLLPSWEELIVEKYASCYALELKSRRKGEILRRWRIIREEPAALLVNRGIPPIELTPREEVE